IQAGAVRPLSLSTGFAPDENLADDRLDGFGRGAEQGVLRWYGPPAEHRVPLFTYNLLEQLLALPPVVRIRRQEHHADAVFAVGRQLDFELIAFLGEEPVWSLQQDAGPIAGVLLAAAGAAMLQVEEDLYRLLSQVVGLAAFQIDDEAHTAGVMLVLRIV